MEKKTPEGKKNTQKQRQNFMISEQSNIHDLSNSMLKSYGMVCIVHINCVRLKIRHTHTQNHPKSISFFTLYFFSTSQIKAKMNRKQEKKKNQLLYR